MNKSIWFFIVFLAGLAIKGQTLSCYKFQAYPEIDFANYFSSQPDFYFQGDTVFLFSQMKASIFVPGQKPREVDLSKLLTKTQKGNLLSNYQFSYYFSQSKLVVRNRNSVFLFSFHKNKFILENSFALKQKYGKHIYLHNTTLYFYGIYDHLKNDEELASGYTSYDLKTQEETVFTFPFPGISITHLGPNKFMDFSENGYVVCDPLRYRLYNYSYTNQLKDSITLSESLFKTSDPARFSKKFDPEKMGSQVVNYLDSMRNYLDTLDRIWMINYIDENTLFVRLTRNSTKAAGKKGQLFYDHLWLKKEDGWHLAQTKDLSNFKIDEAINKENLWPYFFPGSKYIACNGILYYTCWSPYPDSFPQSLKHSSGLDSKDRIA